MAKPGQAASPQHPAERQCSMMGVERMNTRCLEILQPGSPLAMEGTEGKQSYTQLEAAPEPEPILVSFLLGMVKGKMPGYAHRACVVPILSCAEPDAMKLHTLSPPPQPQGANKTSKPLKPS